jgi:hypothetical protein
MNRVDLIRQRFGRLQVESKAANLYDPRKTSGRSAWNCRCDCGATKVVSTSALRSGNTQSCGCLQKEAIHNAKFHDLTGGIFGKLTVIAPAPTHPMYGTMWLCRCSCGKDFVGRAGSLKTGQIRSCGCLRRKLSPEQAQMNRAYRSFIGNAKTRNILIEITQEDWKSLVLKPCYYCRKEYSHAYDTFRCNGIDRKDSNTAYSKENCVPCCKFCNDAKGKLTEREFLDLVKRVYESRVMYA